MNPINAIEGVLKQVLDFLQSHTHSYGWAIVLFALLIKVVLWAPTRQQFKSMKDMQALQPEIKKLQQKYKDDPQKLQQEQMALWKTHGVNPLGGCLPLIIQMPILWAIWRTIDAYKTLFDKEYFLWINPSMHQLFNYPDFHLNLPFFKINGFFIFGQNLAGVDLPMLLMYGFSMYLSQKFSTVDPATAQTQRMLTLTMPIMFTFILAKFPSALILYWLVFNLLSIVQQAMIMRETTPSVAGQEKILDEAKSAGPKEG